MACISIIYVNIYKTLFVKNIISDRILETYNNTIFIKLFIKVN